MRHTCEVAIFLASGVALLARYFGADWWPIVLVQIVLATLYFFTVRPLVAQLHASRNSKTAGVYSNNVALLLVAGIFAIYQQGTFVIGCLLMVGAVVIAVRSVKFGHPLANTGPWYLRGV